MVVVAAAESAVRSSRRKTAAVAVATSRAVALPWTTAAVANGVAPAVSAVAAAVATPAAAVVPAASDVPIFPAQVAVAVATAVAVAVAHSLSAYQAE